MIPVATIATIATIATAATVAAQFGPMARWPDGPMARWPAPRGTSSWLRF